jgi:hypothetical protein
LKGKLIKYGLNYYLMCGEHVHTIIIETEKLRINERGLNVIRYVFVNNVATQIIQTGSKAHTASLTMGAGRISGGKRAEV